MSWLEAIFLATRRLRDFARYSIPGERPCALCRERPGAASLRQTLRGHRHHGSLGSADANSGRSVRTLPAACKQQLLQASTAYE